MTGKKIFLFLAAILVVYSVIWMWYRDSLEERYAGKMSCHDRNTYTYLDEDGYSYNVKLPDYPGFTGNLCITEPGGDVSFFIWPSFGGKYEYGVQIASEGLSVMTDGKGMPQNKSMELPEKQDDISDLVSRADAFWKLSG